MADATLEEVKAVFEDTTNGRHPVNILAYHPEQRFPIFAEVCHLDKWKMYSYTIEGWFANDAEDPSLNLVPKKPRIEYNQLPVDTLIEWMGEKRYVGNQTHENQKEPVWVYCNGRSSETSDGATLAAYKDCRLITNKPQPWFGGKCPLPPGVQVKAWARKSPRSTPGPCEGEAITMSWQHLDRVNDIIIFQILGE